jgi:phosphoglucosamine mutase
VLRVFDTVPQVLRNVRFNGGTPLETASVKATLSDATRRLHEAGGRLLVRKSGTEPLIRVMAEGDDQRLVDEIVGGICAAVEAASGSVPQAAE